MEYHHNLYFEKEMNMRVYNFAAGPAVLPEEVLKIAQEEMLDYKGTGMSVMEMSHRSKAYEGIINEAESLFREVMGIPSNYKVLFLQGGASLQFAMVPMNLMVKNKKADFINTGTWAKKAISEAKKVGSAKVIATSEDKNFTYIPKINQGMISADADYVHITTNNTIEGTKFSSVPDTGKIPLVADMSSNILSESLDVSKFALIYAGAQKNLGPAGVAAVIIRDDLVGLAPESIPVMLNYKTHADEKSLYNTPPCYSIYILGLVLKWIKDRGGIKAMEKTNRDKAAMLYDQIDGSKMFRNPVEKSDRSIMNVVFVTGKDELNDKFVKEAAKAGLVELKGHRSVGGMRASIYNAMPVDGVKKLVEFMKKFEKENS
jgi:phosphoserine aminotransferase